MTVTLTAPGSPPGAFRNPDLRNPKEPAEQIPHPLRLTKARSRVRDGASRGEEPPWCPILRAFCEGRDSTPFAAPESSPA